MLSLIYFSLLTNYFLKAEVLIAIKMRSTTGYPTVDKLSKDHLGYSHSAGESFGGPFDSRLTVGH